MEGAFRDLSERSRLSECEPMRDRSLTVVCDRGRTDVADLLEVGLSGGLPICTASLSQFPLHLSHSHEPR
jgi:hypothetical protein